MQRLRRHRPGAHAAGILLGAADLPTLPRRRQTDQESLFKLPRRRHHRRIAHPVGESASRGRYGRPHPTHGRRPGRPARRPAGRSLCAREVRPHPVFERDGADLHCDIPIGFVDAALGNDLEVPTLSGRVKLKIPSETQTGKLFRLRGKGITPVRGGPPATCFIALSWKHRSNSHRASGNCSRNSARFRKNRATASRREGKVGSTVSSDS